MLMRNKTRLLDYILYNEQFEPLVIRKEDTSSLSSIYEQYPDTHKELPDEELSDEDLICLKLESFMIRTLVMLIYYHTHALLAFDAV